MGKKKFEVMKRSEFAAKEVEGFDLGSGRKRVFNKMSGVMYLSDPGEAQHIKDKYGRDGTGDVLVSEIPDWDSPSKAADQEGVKPIHRNFFVVPELPWKKKEAENDPDAE